MLGEDGTYLNLELERAALRALSATYNDLNHALFSGKLRRPQLVLVDAKATLGAWRRAPRVIEIGRHLLTTHEWGILVEILKHEMAHQYVEEVLGVIDEAAHGSEFREVCRRRAIDPRATGIPLSAETHSEQRVLSTVAKLLALAESGNEHEARSAMSAAHRLMLKHNLDLQASAASSDYGFRHLGKPTGRTDEARRVLAGILADFFFVEVIWVPIWRAREGKRGSVLEICGTAENLEIASYTHDFLLRTAARLWVEYKREQGMTRNAERRTFVSGVMCGFRERLESDRQRNVEQGLVWVGDAALGSYLRARHPRIRWTRHAARPVTEAHAAGRSRGREIVLARGVSGAASEGPVLALKGG